MRSVCEYIHYSILKATSFMKNSNRFSWFIAATIPLAFLSLSGCTKEQASETLKQAEASAEEAAEGIADEVDAAAEKGGEMAEAAAEKASELGEQAMSYMAGLKEKFGDLETLKETPEKLKVAVMELIQTIEEKAEGIKLPEAMSSGLASVKAKLIELKDYLEGEVEQAKIDEHLKEISDSIKSGLGFAK